MLRQARIRKTFARTTLTKPFRRCSSSPSPQYNQNHKATSIFTATSRRQPPLAAYSRIMRASVDNHHPKLVQVLLGNGNGTFKQPPIVLAAGDSPEAVAVGRFDKSKHMGFAVSGLHSGVTIFAGDGKGGFKATFTTPPTTNSVHSLAVADFNHDGIDDVAVGGASPGSVLVML